MCAYCKGVAKGIVTVAMASVVSDIVARDQMNEGMGMFNLGNTISFAFGPMLGLALVDMGGYSTMFLVVNYLRSRCCIRLVYEL